MELPADLPSGELAQRIQQAIVSNDTVILRTHTFSHSMEMYVEQLLTVFLEEVRRDDIKDYVIYSVKELMVNAKKANTKRIYFLEQGLDINVLEDYRQGMKYFKQAAFESTEYYVNLQKEKGLFVELRISREGKSIKIEVWNNTTIAAMEEMRMMNKIKKGEQYANLEDVLGETVDDIEGSGLGLIILILMMKKIGLEKKHRKISVAKQGGNTIVGLKIPVNK